MRTYPLTKDEGSKAFAFEVENTFLSSTTAARLLRNVEGVSDIRTRRMFTRPSDIHVEFKFLGQPYVIWEPFGDNSRYWVGPKDTATAVEEIAPLEDAFKRHRPLLHRFIGDVWARRLLGEK